LITEWTGKLIMSIVAMVRNRISNNEKRTFTSRRDVSEYC
jgi:hypothetical protein